MVTDKANLQRFRDADPGEGAQVSVNAARVLAQQGDLDEAARCCALPSGSNRPAPKRGLGWPGLPTARRSERGRFGTF